MDSQNWCTIESDPGVFTELIESMGAKDVMVEELFDLSNESFDSIAPAFGLLFLFKWTKETSGTGEMTPLSHDETDPKFFFAKQTVTNACATQAILSVLLNSNNRADIGEELKAFHEFTREFNPEMKGDTLGSNPMIRSAHNAFARPEPFVMEDSSGSSSSKKKNRDDDDDDSAAYHFIAYIPFKGGLYELDGLQRGPILLSQGQFKEDDVESSDWLRAVRPHIEARIQRYAQSEIRFNLMAVIRDRRKVLQDRIQKAEQEAKGADEIRVLREELAQVEEKRRQWTEENIRRKHNYVPFIVAALRLLAKRKKLKGLVRAAQEKEAERKRTRDNMMS